MTKEELEKEAKTNISNLKNNALKVNGRPFQIIEGDYIQGYLDGAEPREKRIAELKKLFADCDTCKRTCDMGNCCKFGSDYLPDVGKILNKQKKLTKAKVVLRKVIDYLGQFCSDYPDCVIEAEQFLQEIEE